MIPCILCLGETRENKTFKLDTSINETMSMEQAIRQQIPYADTFLSSPSSLSPSVRITCSRCFRTFKTFYELITKINQNQRFNLEIPIKDEIDDESDVLNISVMQSDEPPIEYKELKLELDQIKIEPDVLNEQLRNESRRDDDFEWEMEDSTFWKEDDDEEKKTEVTKTTKSSKRYREPVDSDYEPFQKAKRPVSYTPYLRPSEITPELLKSGKGFVKIDGIEYKIPKQKYNKELKATNPKAKNNPEGDERVRKFMDIKCELCGAIFQTFFMLGKHFRRIHPGTETFLRCCGRKFYRRLVLLDHLDVHDDSVVHECKECNKRYRTDKTLKSHIDKIHNSKCQEYVCSVCGRTLKSPGALKKHLIFHEEDTRQFECYICKKTKFQNVKLLQIHFSIYHNPNKPLKSVCHICSAVVRSSHLKRHVLSKHSDVEVEKAQCEICEHWITKSRMHIHKKKHVIGGVNCKICGKFLKSQGSLYDHIKILHENCRNYKCDYCDKAFYKEKKLREHVAARHTREFLFKCRVPGCEREFRAEGNWKMHERKAHPEEYEKIFAPYYKRAPQEPEEAIVDEPNTDETALPPFTYF